MLDNTHRLWRVVDFQSSLTTLTDGYLTDSSVIVSIMGNKENNLDGNSDTEPER
jgi:hypothetical protein